MVLQEHRVEPGESGDAYMQGTRNIEFAMKLLREDEDMSIRNYVEEEGAPMFLVYVQGPHLSVAAGFYDGEHVIVERLGESYVMLEGYANRR
ncbi:hypothetical protein M422DRAFT_32715 [Sphaerobolus stellatus SS14]|uniref:Uncharacterized protein n=1 Tax=Sphaerobolus stellatus (strain SS14) TaxID=990650 RepID=A0A0C9VDJ2_SPHS4|nr:hypothetical protein M422DRAFT_32715 [Sphaerobolus stellatus SS14]